MNSPCSSWLKGMNERASYHWQPSLPYLSMNVVVIVEYNDDPSRDPSGTKASISNDDANPKEENTASAA